MEKDARRLVAAIESLSENFALYGPDDRLIVCNKGYRTLNKDIPEASKPGTLFEKHIRASAENTLSPKPSDAKRNGFRNAWRVTATPPGLLSFTVMMAFGCRSTNNACRMVLR